MDINASIIDQQLTGLLEKHSDWLPAGIDLKDISHRNFGEIMQRLQKNKTTYHARAVEKVSDALKQCYGVREISLQQLSATFRRGDLLEMLNAEC
jgi:hypothetical protein